MKDKQIEYTVIHSINDGMDQEIDFKKKYKWYYTEDVFVELAQLDFIRVMPNAGA